MIVQEFVNRYRNIFPFIFRGTIEFFGKEDVIEKKVSRIGTPYNHLKVQRRVLGTEIFDHYFDLVPYDNYVIKQYSISKSVTYPFDKLDHERIEMSIVLHVYGEKFNKQKSLEKMDDD